MHTRAYHRKAWEAVEFWHLGERSAEGGGESAEGGEKSPKAKIVYLPIPYDLPAPAGRYRQDLDIPWYVEYPQERGNIRL